MSTLRAIIAGLVLAIVAGGWFLIRYSPTRLEHELRHSAIPLNQKPNGRNIVT